MFQSPFKVRKQSRTFECKNWKYFKYSKLGKQKFLDYTQEQLSFVGHFCTGYTCLHIRHVFYGNKTILGNGFQKLIDRKCAGITLDQYNNLSPSDETWYCWSCKAQMFSFLNLRDYQLYSIITLTRKKNRKKLNSIKSKFDPNTFGKHFPICLKKNHKI